MKERVRVVYVSEAHVRAIYRALGDAAAEYSTVRDQKIAAAAEVAVSRAKLRALLVSMAAELDEDERREQQAWP